SSRPNEPGLRHVSGPAGDPITDLYAGRYPTSHERRTGQPWDVSYHDGPAPWDVGPQPAIVRKAAAGAFSGAVLDAGCGTGDNALYLASLGLRILGLDVAPTAIARARRKAAKRGLDAEFEVADALALESLGRSFDTVLDCALFHTFEEVDERRQYVAGLTAVTPPGATLYLLCFSDVDPDSVPHPVSVDELHAAFNPATGWTIAAVEVERVETRFHADGAPGWLTTVTRL